MTVLKKLRKKKEMSTGQPVKGTIFRCKYLLIQ